MKDRAIILARASSGKQVMQGDTLDDQIRKCTRYIIKNELDKYKVFPLVESGRKGEREYFQEVLRFCEEPKNMVKYVVFINISRFTRQGEAKYFHFKERLGKAGVQIRDILGTIGEEVDTMEDTGFSYDWSVFSPTEASEASEANEAKSYVRKVLTQMIGAEINYVNMGYWNRRPPYGYQNHKIETSDGLRNILIPDPKESDYIVEMFNLRADSTLSDKEIVSRLNKMGYVSREYRRHEKKTRKVIGKYGRRKLTVKQLQKYISNPVYAGIIKEKWTHGQPIIGKFTGLVSANLFNKASHGKLTINIDQSSNLATLETNKDDKSNKLAKRRPKNNPEYPFRGSVMCPVCGNALTASAPRGRNGKRYPAYHCARSHKLWSIPSDKMHTEVDGFVRRLKFDNELLDLFELSFVDVWKRKRQNAVRESQLAENTVTDLLVKQNAIYESMPGLSNQLIIKRMEEEYDQLEKQIKIARTERKSREDKELNVKQAVKYALYLMEHPEELLINTDNPLQKKEVFGLFFDNLPTYSQLNNGTANLSPVFSLNSNGNLEKSSMVTL